MNIIFRGVSDPHGAAVYLTREAVRSEWSTDERFTNVAFDIFIFHYNPAARLLFICSSRRHEKLYSFLAKQLAHGRPRPLSANRINRVLNDLSDAEFFSVGMKKRNKLGQSESYRTMTGPSADKAVNPTDARTFDRGHYFGRARENGNEVTIGVSAGSKVWSNRYDRIPELLHWCNRLANRINSRIVPVTGSGLDLLSIGEELTFVPEGIIAMAWSPGTYSDPPRVSYTRQGGARAQSDLLDFDLEVLVSRRDELVFTIRNAETEWRGRYSLEGVDLFQPASPDEPELSVIDRDEEVAIVEYLNELMPILYCSDLSSIEGQSLFRAPIALQSSTTTITRLLIGRPQTSKSLRRKRRPSADKRRSSIGLGAADCIRRASRILRRRLGRNGGFYCHPRIRGRAKGENVSLQGEQRRARWRSRQGFGGSLFAGHQILWMVSSSRIP